jgi:hypothetical protein
MKIGTTGTKNGGSPEQLAEARRKLVEWQSQGADELHHGWCIGWDDQIAAIAKELGYRIVAHPGFGPKNPESTKYRGLFNKNDEVRESKPFIKRDQDIVNETDCVLAGPAGRIEQVRSGTWTTVRFARKQGRREPDQLYICRPSALPPLPPPNPLPRTNAIAGETPLTPPHLKRGLR